MAQQPENARQARTPQRNFVRALPWGELPRPAAGAPGSPANPTPSGILLIDKPSGVTSHDVVGAVRRLAGTRKVGHAGTLDPLATGLLTVGVGAATRLLTYLTGERKAYEATVRFGVATTSEDAAGELLLDTLGVRADFSEQLLDAAIAQLTGEIMQVPSAVSAIKVAGERAYERVRAGEKVELAARPITVYRFERVSPPRMAQVEVRPGQFVPAIDVDVRAEVSAGTYIRALGRDLGAALGMGAHLTRLRRTRVGRWYVTQAYAVTALAQLVREGQPLPILPLATAASAVLEPAIVTLAQAQALRHGQFIELIPAPAHYPVALLLPSNAPAAARSESAPQGPAELVAIGKARGRLTAPAVVFAQS